MRAACFVPGLPRKICLIGLFAAGAVFLLLLACGGYGQRQLFFAEGRELFSDYWMPRITIETGYSLGDDIEAIGIIKANFSRSEQNLI